MDLLKAENPRMLSTSSTKIKKHWFARWKAEPVLFWNTVILLSTGIIMVFSASMTTSIYAYHDVLFFLKRHLLGVLLSVPFFLLGSLLSLQKLRQLSSRILLLNLLLLLMVFFPVIGREGGGSARWLSFGPFNLQPSEFAKFSVLLYLASALSTHQERIKDFWLGVLPSFLMIGIICLLILLEPDLGTASFIIAITLITLFVGGSRLLHLLICMGALLPSGIFLVLFSGKEYWMRRIEAFLNPWNDPQGKGFQIIQSLIALGSGGIFGKGLGESKQKFFFLPDRHTDFIFAIIGEELGFLGAIFVMVLFMVVLWKGWKIATSSRDNFQAVLGMGITASIALQALINIGGVTGTIPVTGITLPLISYGNSSLVVTMFQLGILFNIAYENKFRNDKL